MKLRVVLAVATAIVAALFVATPARADAIVSLYTIGPGSYLFARYGHSLLCVRDAAETPGRCYDFGVPDRDEAVHMTWASVRGEPIFVPVRVDETVVLQVFGDQGRSIERQRLPLTADEAQRLADRLERDARERKPYAYHPYFSNCTTQVRDRLDEITNGKLRPGKKIASPPRYRELAEEGLSGRVPELTALAFLLGGPNEERPSAWEIMFLPESLKDGVTDRFGVAPERVEELKAVTLPTSSSVGRLAILFLAVILLVVTRWGARALVGGDEPLPRRTRLSLAIVGVVLGGMALFADVVAALVVWPEFRHNWALVALLPTDFALPFLGRRALRVYASARLATTVALVIAEIAGVVAQPLLPVAALVAFPMASIAFALTAGRAERSSDTPRSRIA